MRRASPNAMVRNEDDTRLSVRNLSGTVHPAQNLEWGKARKRRRLPHGRQRLFR